MKFLTDYELQHLEHASLRVKYRELQIVIESSGISYYEVEDEVAVCSQKCSCTLDGVTCGACQSDKPKDFDKQAADAFTEGQAKSVARDTAKGINGYGD